MKTNQTKLRIQFKGIAILLILTTFQLQLFSQTALDSTNNQLRQLFGNLARPVPSKLFNWDMAAHFMDSSLYVAENFTDTLDTENWLSMYEEMQYCAFDNTWMKKVDSVYWPCMQFGTDTVNMLVMNYDYYRFKQGALDSNIYFNFDTVNNVLTDKPNRPGFPYNEFKVFAAAPSSDSKNGNNIVFRVGTNNIFYDQFNKLDAAAAAAGYGLQFDFGDGYGWRNVILGQDNYFYVHYTVAGDMIIKSRVLFNSDPITFSKSKMFIKKVRAGILDSADEIIKKSGILVNVYNPCNMTPADPFMKTLIYLEGFDMMDFLPNENRTATAIYDEQIIESGLSDLRNFGYRIMVVDWDNSRLDIKHNARHLQLFLEFLKCQMSENDNNEEFVIIGESMGGLVARFAMLTMEQIPSGCLPEKEHNTRLLITLDSPHGGAHIPMGLQRLYQYLRNTAGGIIGGAVGGTIGVAAGGGAGFGVGILAGIPLGSLAFKMVLKSQDMFLEGDAAKQMLMDHVSTAGLFNPTSFSAHQMRTDFVTDLQALGNFPRHAKLMALSNGNMAGKGQTRYWDGQPRQDNDRLLHYNTKLFFTILGRKFNYAGLNLEMNNDPNGAGTIGKLTYGTWFIKIKLRLFGIKIHTGFNSLCYKDWDGILESMGTSSGGLLDYNLILERGLFSKLPYDVNGAYAANTNHIKNGRTENASTDGFHWSFVPSFSALAAGHAANIPFDLSNLNAGLGSLPFDVFCGVPGQATNGLATNLPSEFQDNVELKNRFHTYVRNDTLADRTVNPVVFEEYDPNLCVSPFVTKRYIQMLNREIGDNEIFLENRILPWRASISATEKISANVHNPFYVYANAPFTTNKFPSLWSKQKPFIINNFEMFTTLTNNINYQAPFSGPWGTNMLNSGMCCENFHKKAVDIPATFIIAKTKISLYPNPSNGSFNLQIKAAETGIATVNIYDFAGKFISKHSIVLPKTNTTYYLPISLVATPGIYIVKTVINNNQFTNKLKIN